MGRSSSAAHHCVLEAAEESGGGTWAAGERAAIFVGPAPADKLPKDATAGRLLAGAVALVKPASSAAGSQGGSPGNAFDASGATPGWVLPRTAASSRLPPGGVPRVGQPVASCRPSPPPRSPRPLPAPPQLPWRQCPKFRATPSWRKTSAHLLSTTSSM